MVNAVVRRSYSMAGDHIRVSIFPHRIEVFSSGRFPGPGDPSRPLEIARYARNPRIARGAPNRARPQGPGPPRPAARADGDSSPSEYGPADHRLRSMYP